MSDRPSHSQPDDRELRDTFGRLSAMQPDESTSQQALDLARQALERSEQTNTAQPSASRDAKRAPHFWFWRIAMPVGLLTTTALVVAFLFTSATPQAASAAEILQRAAKARAAFEGWYALELCHPETGVWHQVQRANTAAGKWLERDGGEFSPAETGLNSTDWVYKDRPEGIVIQYRAATRTATLLDYEADPGSLADIPLDEEQLLAWIDSEGTYTTQYTRKDSGKIVIDVRISEVSEDVEQARTDDTSGYPYRGRFELDAESGLLKEVWIQQRREDELVPYARVSYHTEPIDTWQDLVDDTIEIDDRRADPQARELIDALRAVWRDGLGFDTGVVVERTGHPIRGTLNEKGRVTLYAEREGMIAKFKWTRGREIPGWPEPTLEAVVSHLDQHAPEVVFVSDGQDAWWRWGEDEAWNQRPSDSALISGVLDGARLIGQIWPSLSDVYYDPTNRGVQPTVERDPKRSNGVILKTISMTRWEGTPADALVVGTKRNITFLEDLGPYPLVNTIERYDKDGELWSRQTTRFGLGDMVMYRHPVRVPLYWKYTWESPRSDTLPEFNHLMPHPGKQIDAKWFTDPTTRWPQQDPEEPIE
ncbi:MAG: hypothetical protein AAGA25_05325 [Planctomycetota bacterium]